MTQAPPTRPESKVSPLAVVGGYLMLLGYSLFNHGCHGPDDDHELSLLPWFSPEPIPEEVATSSFAQ
jgi:hypothetical protein